MIYLNPESRIKKIRLLSELNILLITLLINFFNPIFPSRRIKEKSKGIDISNTSNSPRVDELGKLPDGDLLIGAGITFPFTGIYLNINTLGHNF